MAARVTNAQLMDRLIVIDERTDKLERQVDRHTVYWQIAFKIGAFLVAVLMVVLSTFIQHSFASWEASTRLESDMALLSSEVMEAEPTPTVASVPQQPKPKPSAVPKQPTPTAMPSFPNYEREWLARLCVVEVRGMDEARDQACLSIISTVLTRASRRLISDGTIRGTLTWGCGPDTVSCQFPAYTVNGCAGISAMACPLSYPDDIEHFRDIVDLYFSGIPPRCSGYLFYGIREFDRPECVIASENGQFLNFWERVAPHE